MAEKRIMDFEELIRGIDPEEGDTVSKHDDAYYLVAYDISDSKLRLKVAKELKGYGVRVQRSVFECKTSQAKYHQLIKKLQQMIQSPDSVRIYKLTKTSPIKVLGCQDPVFDDEEEDYYFI